MLGKPFSKQAELGAAAEALRCHRGVGTEIPHASKEYHSQALQNNGMAAVSSLQLKTLPRHTTSMFKGFPLPISSELGPAEIIN